MRMNKELNDLVEKHYKENFTRLSRFYRYRRGVRDGEDLVHDVYVKILEFNIIPNNFDRFFKIVIENTFRDYKRKDRIRKGLKRDYRIMFSREAHMEMGPDELQILSEIEKLIDKKNGKIKDILHLAFSCQLDPRDIADLVDATPNTIWKYIFRFRQELRNSGLFPGEGNSPQNVLGSPRSKPTDHPLSKKVS